MGVYIKGMEMPTSCAGCELAEHYERYGSEHYCPVMGWYADYEKCPLIPVPVHGRLIDADALMQQIEHDTPLSAVFEKTMRRYLNAAPTIIPASEE